MAPQNATPVQIPRGRYRVESQKHSAVPRHLRVCRLVCRYVWHRWRCGEGPSHAAHGCAPVGGLCDGGGDDNVHVGVGHCDVRGLRNPAVGLRLVPVRSRIAIDSSGSVWCELFRGQVQAVFLHFDVDRRGRSDLDGADGVAELVRVDRS